MITMHRMGSYFGPTAPAAAPSMASSSSSLAAPMPPPPPPTSSIPQKPVLKRASLAAAIGIPTVTTAAEVVSGRFGFVTNKVSSTPPHAAPEYYSASAASTSSELPSPPRRLAAPSERVRRNLQRLRYEDNDMRQINALNKRLESLTIADMSPRLTLQRIMLLYERGEYREAAAFIRRVSPPTYRQIVTELPIDRFVDSMPHSMPVLEAIYAKVYLASNMGSPTMAGRLSANFSPECVVWQIVRFFACLEDPPASANAAGVAMDCGDGGIAGTRMELCGPWVSTCKRLLAVLLSAEPRIRRLVADRRRALTKAIEGLGQHGLVGTSDQALTDLHNALKSEFERVHKTYTEILSKLGHSASDATKTAKSNSGGISKGPPVAQSHQRQLSLRVDEIQERLIRNKTLLNVIEPSLENPSLEVLLGILQRRIELDKEGLFQFNQLKKDRRLLMTSSRNPSVAPVIMRFQKGCQQVLDLMREVSDEERRGGHVAADDGESFRRHEEKEEEDEDPKSDSDSSAVMMSGNSPFVSKSARYNFLQRSVRSGGKHNLRTAISFDNIKSGSGGVAAAIKSRNNAAAKKKTMSNSSSGVSSGDGCGFSGGSSSSGTASPPDSDCYDPAGTSPQSFTASAKKSIVVVGADGSSIIHHIGGNDIILSRSDKTSATAGQDEETSSTSSASSIPESARFSPANSRKFFREIQPTLLTSMTMQRGRKFRKDVTPPASSSGLGSRTVSAGDLTRCDRCDHRQPNSGSSPFSSGHSTANAVRPPSTSAAARQLQEEVSSLRHQLEDARRSVAAMERDHDLYYGHAEEIQSLASSTAATAIYDVQNGDCRPAGLVRKFGELYSIARLDALDAFDAIADLDDATELKGKLLFSVVVLSFRSSTSALSKIRDQVRKLLQLPLRPTTTENAGSRNSYRNVAGSSACTEVEAALSKYMRRAADSFDLAKTEEEVAMQLCSTLYDYPCLKSCKGLQKYIESCVRVSWGLVNQMPQYVISYDERVFQPDLHVRYPHLSCPTSDSVKTYLWPALREGKDGPCVHKAVIVT